MLALRVELNVLDDHHLVVVDVEERVVHDASHGLLVALGQERDWPSPCVRRCADQAVTRGIFAHAAKQFDVNVLRARVALAGF